MKEHRTNTELKLMERLTWGPTASQNWVKVQKRAWPRQTPFLLWEQATISELNIILYWQNIFVTFFQSEIKSVVISPSGELTKTVLSQAESVERRERLHSRDQLLQTLLLVTALLQQSTVVKVKLWQREKEVRNKKSKKKKKNHTETRILSQMKHRTYRL